jgi:hypothetical protein
MPLVIGYVFWTPITVLNFWIVPVNLRVLYMSCMCIVWDTFISFAVNNDVTESIEQVRKKTFG